MNSQPTPRGRAPVTLCLTGDVMTGRGIDQILQHPGDPVIHERSVRSATDYVALAEQRTGPIPRGVSPAYPWGDALGVIRRRRPDVFIVNLETAVTDQGTPWPGKGIHYRMHPANVGLLAAAGVDVAVLANNHVLDWSPPGLDQTLAAVRATGVVTVGAGRDAGEAWRPATVTTATGARVVVLAAGTASAGVPASWAAGERRPGVAFLDDLSSQAVDRMAATVAAVRRPGDMVVLSLHWGPNWGYEIPEAHRRFARALIDEAGVHVVHGHSSHHPLGIEVHRGRLILYGCGDLITDYEGIHGHEYYRGELGAMYLPTIDPSTATLQRLDVVPTRMERFRLTHPGGHDLAWLAATLDREGAELGTTVSIDDGGVLRVDW